MEGLSLLSFLLEVVHAVAGDVWGWSKDEDDDEDESEDESKSARERERVTPALGAWCVKERILVGPAPSPSLFILKIGDGTCSRTVK